MACHGNGVLVVYVVDVPVGVSIKRGKQQKI